MHIIWTKEIKGAIASALGLDLGKIDITLPPKNMKDVDLCVPLFVLAKERSQSPVDLGREIEAAWDKPKIVDALSVAGGFLNIKLNREWVAKEFFDYEKSGDTLRHIALHGQKILLEHTSINPNASPHVGRSRNAMLGDTLVRLFRRLGADVDARYYVNDMGKQIALLAIAIREKGQLSFDEMLEAYVEINSRLEKEPDLEKIAFEMIKNIEQGDQSVKKEFRDVVTICLKGQGKILDRLGISFDHFDWESDFVDLDKFQEVFDALEKKDAFTPDELGRTVVDLKNFGHNREEGRYIVLRRSNGSALYMMRDLFYNKFKDAQKADRNIILLGEDHKMYYEQLAMLSNLDDVKPPEAIFYSYVLLKDGKMSTRKGNVVLLENMLDELEEAALLKIKERKEGQDIGSEEMEKIAKSVAKAACRFSFLRVAAGSNIHFDIENAINFEGDTGPYIIYSAVRAQSVLNKAEVRDVNPNWSDLNDEEWDLLCELAREDLIVKRAADNMETTQLCDYALAIAKAYGRFYQKCQIIGDPEEVRRLALTEAVVACLKRTTEILGIDIPERM